MRVDRSNLGLLTDLYELRMAQTCLKAGMTAPATFTLYIRPTAGRPWHLAAGTEAAIECLERFRYGREEIDYLATQGFDDALLSWLEMCEPQGEVWALADGTITLANAPLLEVTAPMPYAMLLETALMNVVQYPTLIATKAARCVVAADGRAIADFGARRAHGLDTSVAAARAAYVGGAGGTSNVEAGRRHGIPLIGTMAHSFIQAYEDEVAAFRAFGEDHPENSTMLVDTYDTIEGVHNAIEVGRALRDGGHDLQGIRLDSGDLIELSKQSRELLDDAGFTDAQIVASGGIDEEEIARLIAAGARIDAFGVGTSLTTSRDIPALDIVYKLAAYDGEPRAKYSEGKVSLPGAKQTFRTGSIADDVLGRRGEDHDGEPLLAPVWRDGERLCRFDLHEARERAAEQLDLLPDEWRDPAFPGPPPEPRLSDALRELADEVRERELQRTS